MNESILPPARENQEYVEVSALVGGFITLSDHFFVHPATPGARRTVPSLAFLIKHPGLETSKERGPTYIMFDLGLRKAKERYPKKLQDHLEVRAPYDLSPGVAAQLEQGGIDPNDVSYVILSHVHYDHHGDPEDFPSAEFIVGPGALNLLKHGLGEIASHQNFDPDTLPEGRAREPFDDPRINPDGWRALGPFPHTIDFFHDGTLYVIDTPGHLYGHINLLCRTKNKWVLLCGDAFHDSRLLTGEKQIGTWKDTNGEILCIHLDKESAWQSIERLRKFQQITRNRVELIAAHDDGWWKANQHSRYPGTI